MNDDYRNTIYCPRLDGIKDRKKAVEDMIIRDHPKATDMHNWLHKNDNVYKEPFIKAYNGKCAYCGAMVPKRSFQIDHFLCESSLKKKSDAGYMANLVLACDNCNLNKSDYMIPSEYIDQLHPDGTGITECFHRDDLYYIRIAYGITDGVICGFYNTLRLGNELRRLDYLLMNMRGLKKQLSSMKGMEKVYMELDKVTEMIQKKRNMV